MIPLVLVKFMDDKEQSKEDILRLKRELAETKHRLFLLENSRPIKLVIFAKSFLKNPVKGVANIGGLREALRKVEASKLEISQAASDRIVPLSLRTNNPLMRYPNIKVATLGCLDEVADVCHAFGLGDANWMILQDLWINFVMVTDEAFAKTPEAKTWLKTAKDKEIPLVVVKTFDGDLPEPLLNADLILDRTNNNTTDEPFVDIFHDNPMNWQREPKPVIGLAGLKKDKVSNLDDVGLEEVSESSSGGTYSVTIAKADNLQRFATMSQLLRFSAKGIPVIVSGDSESSDKPFEFVKTLDDAIKLGKELSVDFEKRERASIQQRRQTTLNHSQLQHFEFILGKLGIETREPEKISAILSTMRQEHMNQALHNFAKQTYPNKELVILLHGDGFDRQKIEDEANKLGITYKIIEKPKSSIFGSNLNVALDATTGDLVTKMDDDDFYGENHLLDLLAAYRYSRADMVGKWANWVYIKSKDITTSWVVENQETITHHLPGATFMANREFLCKSRFGIVNRAIDSELYRRVEARGAMLYSTHSYNYVRNRHGAHTYTASDEEFMSRCSEPTFKGFDKDRTSA
jgi:hypothetical protein